STCAEHRLVMSVLLARPLTADESVHHRDGDRLNNRPENLELWTRWQRIDDRVAAARLLLEQYAPHLLIGETDP
ncbi:MAG TPA: HNH endonuclease, partial [Mycobacteriales bacterium]|nr:HNH endonuclease [Mycobacteriales bacterium]